MLTKQLNQRLMVSHKTERFSETAEVLMKFGHTHDDSERLPFYL